MYYVYEWYVKDSGEIFYVGKGTKNRYKVKKHNRFFNDFITRYECESRIIKEFDDEESAFNYEFERINELKSKGMCKCNIYQGGLGGSTSWWNEEKRKQYSQNNVMKSEKQRKRMRENNPMRNEEYCKKSHEKRKKKICIGEKIYDGIIDVAKEYGVYDTAVQYWLERGYSPEELPCYYYGEEIPTVIIRKGNCNKKPVILDGIKYPSLKDACESIGVSNTTWLCKQLKKGKTTYKGHTVRYDNQQPSQGNTD